MNVLNGLENSGILGIKGALRAPSQLLNFQIIMKHLKTDLKQT